MSVFYITQDKVGLDTSGGYVSGFEYNALSFLGEEMVCIDGKLITRAMDPFENDERYCRAVKKLVDQNGPPRLAHFYAGCFTLTVEYLKFKGTRIAYSCDPHDPDLSVEETRICGYDYPFSYMSDPNLRKIYLEGYRLADAVSVPSKNGLEIVKRTVGCENVRIIPHPVKPIKPCKIRGDFSVGYLGETGPDKGLRYLLQAWKSLDLGDSNLIIAGSIGFTLLDQWRRIGGKNIEIMGRIPNVEDFFERISVYIQPSVTEGFGLPVIEAMASGRPVIVSEGAGAADAVLSEPSPTGIRVPIRNSRAIADTIQFYHDHPDSIRNHGENAIARSKAYDPEIIRGCYLDFWKSLW